MRNDVTKPGTIKSGIRLFEIVDLLQERGELGVSELASILDVSKGTAHRYLKTLEAGDFVVNEDGTYRLGLRFLDHGIYARDQHPLWPVAKPKVDRVAEEVGERSWCVVEENGMAVFMYGAVGEDAVQSDARTGYRNHLHATASGKAILAYLPRDRIEEIIDQRGLPSKTTNTISSRDELYDELTQIREQGFAINLQESVEGLHAVAAPIRNSDGVIYGTVSVTGAADRIPENVCRETVCPTVRAAANEIELDLQFS